MSEELALSGGEVAKLRGGERSSSPGYLTTSPPHYLTTSPSSNPPGTHHKSLITHYSFRVTREGWCWLIVAAVLWGIGLSKGVNLITLLGTLLLATWGFNVVFAGRRLRRLWLRRWAEVPVFAQTSFNVWVEVANRGRKAQIGIRLEDRGVSQESGVRNQESEIRSQTPGLEWLIPRLDPGQRMQFCHQLVLPSRGRYILEALSARSSYPLGLAERRVGAGSGEELIVFPRIGRLHRGKLRRMLAQAAPILGRAQSRPMRHPAARSDFHGLRAFRIGDSPHWIHWRTSARRDELMVREFEETPTDNLVLIVDPFTPSSDIPYPPLEEVISLAATICWEWCRQTGDRFVLATAGDAPAVIDGYTGRDLGIRLLNHLAIEAGTSSPNLAKLVERLKPVLPHAPIILVSTRAKGLETDLQDDLRRPIARVDVSNVKEIDFVEW